MNKIRERFIWSYRIVYNMYSDSSMNHYAIHEVYFDENNKSFACTREPVSPIGHDLNEFFDELNKYKEAFTADILYFDNEKNEFIETS